MPEPRRPKVFGIAPRFTADSTDGADKASPVFPVFCSKLRCSSRALKSLRRGNCGSIQTRIRPVNSLFVAPLAPLCGPHGLAAKRLKTSGITPSSVTSVCSCSPAWAVRVFAQTAGRLGSLSRRTNEVRLVLTIVPLQRPSAGARLRSMVINTTAATTRTAANRTRDVTGSPRINQPRMTATSGLT